MNINQIKKWVSEIIELTDELSEELYLEGYSAGGFSFETDCGYFKKVQQELTNYQNTDIFSFIILKADKDCVPYFDEEKFLFYLNIKNQREKSRVAQLEEKITQRRNFLDSVNYENQEG